MIHCEFKIEPDYVYTHCSGSFSVDNILRVFDKCPSLAEENRLTAILVDVRELGGAPPATLERYRMGEGISKVQRKYSPLIAIAVVGHEPMMDPQHFGETVAVNRGGYGKAFTSLEKAVSWLETVNKEQTD